MITTQITVTDPVCGMTVDPGVSRRSEHDGSLISFVVPGARRSSKVIRRPF